MLIGIIGKIGVGKTTIAEYLKTKGFVEYSFATPLKKIGELFGFTDKELYGTQEDKLKLNQHWGISGRYFLQKFGDVLRSISSTIPEMSDSVIIKLFEIERKKYNNCNCVVSDVRFLDEAKAITKLGGTLIRVTKVNDNNDTDTKEEYKKHISETEQDLIKEDILIENNGTVDELYAKIDNEIYVMENGIENFIEKYYDEFGDKCPFKYNKMGCDAKELEKEYGPKIKDDISLLEKFFKATVDELLNGTVFTPKEIEKLKYADHYWDIPKINFMYTTQESSLTSKNVIEAAVKYGNLRLMKWVENKKYSIKHHTFCYALEKNNIEILKWYKMLYDSCYDDLTTDHYYNTISLAIEAKCSIDIILWLLKNKFPLSSLTLEVAVRNSNLAIINLLLAYNCPLSSYIFECAAGKGDLKIMELLLNHKCPWDEDTFSKAAEEGHLSVMKWLHEKGCPWDEDTFSKAASHGNLYIMKWLYENKCPWDEYTFEAAAWNSNLNNMKWLHEKGCPWGTSTFEAAATTYNSEINTKWLLENKCPFDWNDIPLSIYDKIRITLD